MEPFDYTGKHQCEFFGEDDQFCPHWAIRDEAYCLEHLAESLAVGRIEEPFAPPPDFGQDVGGRYSDDAGDLI